MPLQIYLRGRNADGTRSPLYKDITSVCGAITLEGEVKGASRKLSFEVVRKKMDYFLDMVGTLERGDAVLVSDTGSPDIDKAVFYGLVWRVSESDANVLKNVVCYDNMRFLMTSDCITNVWTDVTAKEVTETVCKELGVTMGKVPDTDVKVNVNARDRNGYEAIMIAWTETRKVTEKFYYPRMVGYKLHVIEKGEMLEGHDLKYQSEALPGNLISVTKGEDSAGAVSCIFERDEAGKATFKESDKALAHRYGYIVGVNDMGQSTKQSAVKAINEGEKTVEVSAVGDWAVQTGWSVRLISNVLTADQLYIEHDAHFYENGLHTMNLTLSYENSMDEIENKEDETASEGNGGDLFTSGASNEVIIWNFCRAQGFSAAATAGIMGNMEAESGLKPDITEVGGYGGYGLCQWTNTGAGDAARKTNLINWCKSKGYDYRTLEGQLNFMMYEFKNKPYYWNNLGNTFMQLTDVWQATDRWLTYFEGCTVRTPIVQWPRRIKSANLYYSKYSKYNQIPLPNQGGAGQGDGLATGKWHHPVPSCYAAWKTYGGHTNNAGDLAAPQGTPVVACDGGTVIWTQNWDGRRYGQYGPNELATYGNCILIDHGNGRTSRYAHLHQKFFAKGAKVSRGQQIGTIGSTGNSTGPHLHLEIVVNGVGIYPGNINFLRS